MPDNTNEEVDVDHYTFVLDGDFPERFAEALTKMQVKNQVILHSLRWTRYKWEDSDEVYTIWYGGKVNDGNTITAAQ